VLVTSLPEWLYPGPDGGWAAVRATNPTGVKSAYSPFWPLLPYAPIMSIM
jgi:hypothetical protein